MFNYIHEILAYKTHAFLPSPPPWKCTSKMAILSLLFKDIYSNSLSGGYQVISLSSQPIFPTPNSICVHPVHISLIPSLQTLIPAVLRLFYVFPSFSPFHSFSPLSILSHPLSLVILSFRPIKQCMDNE